MVDTPFGHPYQLKVIELDDNGRSGVRLSTSCPHEHLGSGISYNRFCLFIVLAHQREAERSALRRHDGHAVDAVVAHFIEDCSKRLMDAP